MLSLSLAGLISTSIQAILYGFSVLMFILTLWILLKKKRRNRVLMTLACLLLTLATAEMICNVIRICEGFLSVGPHLPGGIESFFADVSQRTFVIKSCLFNTQTLILDGVVIYRAYVVWQNIYVIIVPIMGWIALLATSIGLNVALATASTHASDVFAAETGRWITSVYALTLATNLLATSLLAYRIWSVNKEVAQFRLHDHLTPILRVVIESGAIYSLTIIAALITFVIASPGVYILLDMISPIISIVFNMIIIRIGLESSPYLLPFGPGRPLSTSLTTGHRTGLTNKPRGPDTFEMKGLAIEVTQLHETFADDADESPTLKEGQQIPPAQGSSS